MNPLSVCAETVFRSLPFEQRVREIAKEGFLIEFWHRHRRAPAATQAVLRKVAVAPQE